jgi:hypothetical protein
VEPIAVPADEKHFVLHISRRLEIQQVHLIRKPLPLTFFTAPVEHGVSGVGSIDQTEVGSNLPRRCQQLKQLSRNNGTGASQNRTWTG